MSPWEYQCWILTQAFEHVLLTEMASEEKREVETEQTTEGERGNAERKEEKGDASFWSFFSLCSTTVCCIMFLIYSAISQWKQQDGETKKEDAIASYEAWKARKAESLKMKAKEKQDTMRKEQRASEEKEEKRQSAQQVFNEFICITWRYNEHFSGRSRC